MGKEDKKITIADIKNYFVSESDLISSDKNFAADIITEEGYDVEILKREGLSLVEKLMVKARGENEIIDLKQSWDFILQQMSKIGLSKKFVENRIIPNHILQGLEGSPNFKKYFNSAVDYISTVFDWEKNQLTKHGNISLSTIPSSNVVMFKKPSNSNLSQIKAYSHYVHYIAKTAHKAYSKKDIQEYPTNIDEFRNLILKKSGKLDLESTLSTVWDLGICVIPLTDSGIFHGAAWNISGRHVIVLKQKTNSHAKWLFDLLHEMYHVFVHLEDDDTSVIETEELSLISSNDSEEEREANTFANQLILGENVEELAKKCIRRAHNRTEMLKQAVVDVAKEENVRVDSLANYLAYRLNSEGTNWWGPAHGLQVLEPSPIEMTKNYLLKNLDFNRLNDIESNMLSMAIN
jgi:Zn-dependent peptidase ImmA (M78 family)